MAARSRRTSRVPPPCRVSRRISSGVLYLGSTQKTLSGITATLKRSDEPGERSYPAMRLVVVGGVAAGTKAASRARRVDPEVEITVYQGEPEPSISECGLP